MDNANTPDIDLEGDEMVGGGPFDFGSSDADYLAELNEQWAIERIEDEGIEQARLSFLR